MALCDSLVPVQADQHFTPLDFIRSGRSGFAHTPLGK
jgi:hypothetical protein